MFRIYPETVVFDYMPREYERTKNPLYAWEAFEQYRNMKKPIPEWVLEYLDRAAENLVDLANDDPPPARDQVDRAIAVAIEMKIPGRRGRDTVFNTYAITKRASKRVRQNKQILKAMLIYNESIEAVATALHEEFGVSISAMKSKVRRAWKKDLLSRRLNEMKFS